MATAVQLWFVEYARPPRDTGRYVVTDRKGTRLQFQSKVEAIAEAQLRNGWQVDGSEQNYSSQVKRALQ